MEQKKECKNSNECTCPSSSCARHGTCCECVKYHLAKGNLPMCMRGIKQK